MYFVRRQLFQCNNQITEGTKQNSWTVVDFCKHGPCDLKNLKTMELVKTGQKVATKRNDI